MKPLNLLIRCDASIEIGLGHVTRCLVLANKFKDQGHHVFFALKNYPLGIQKVTEQGFQYHLPKMPFDYQQWLLTLATQLKVDIFVGDVRDGLPIVAIEKLKETNILTVAIDEPSDYRKACDLCFYPPHAQLEQLDWSGFTGEIKQGFEYVLLRPEFYQHYERPINNKPNVLVMMGGTDPERLTLPLITKLLKIETLINLQVIIAPDHPDSKEINQKPIKRYSNINDMAKFLTTINYAIIGFGTSAYELMTMGIPATHICLNKEQLQASQYFQQRDFAYTLPQEALFFPTPIIDFKIKGDSFKIKNCMITEKILKICMSIDLKEP